MPGVTTSTEDIDNRRYYWLVPIIFFTAFAVLYFFGQPLLNDNDVPWHLATGTYLLHHPLPKTDPFAYGNENQPWYILSWLWDLLLGIVQQWYGAIGAFLFTAALGAALTAGTCLRLLKMNIALPAVFVATVFTGFCLRDFLTARPQLAAYVLAFMFHALLHRSRNDTGFRSLRWLPVLMLFWVNSHGSFMVGFTIMGAYAIEAWLAHNHVWLKHIVMAGMVCAMCTLVNPYGPEVVTGMLRTLHGSPTKYTAEWQSFNFGASTGLSLWVIMMLIFSNLRYAKVPIADKILTVCWFIGTMTVIRNGPIFILLSAPYLASCLDEQTRGLRKAQPDSPFALFMARQSLKNVWGWCICACFTFCTFAAGLPHADRVESPEFRIKDAVDYVLKNYPDHRFYADYNFSGEIIYRTQGKLHFFMDSRAETAYSNQDMKNYINFQRLTDGWEDTLKARGLNGIIVPNGGYIGFAHAYYNGFYHDHWKLVFEGVRANVYVARATEKGE